MPHVPRTTIHGFAKRGLTLLVDVTTTLASGDLSDVEFQVGAVTKTGLTPTDGGSGVEIAVVLTDVDLNIAPGIYGWECRATVSSQSAVLAAGVFQLAAEPTVT